MSQSSVEHTMSRIAGSTAESPIAVFACNRSDMVNAMFADTVESQRKIRAETPGLRLPGAIDPFETAVRTIIGQQVSVAAATTVMGRIVQAYGGSILTPWPQLNRLSLTPARLAQESIDTLAPLGLNSARAGALLTLSRSLTEGKISLSPSADPERAMARLQELPGIGPWTAHYFGMRILGWPDAFIGGDLVVKKALAPLTPRQIEARSAAWRPWRGYAVMHLWHSTGFFKTNARPATS